MKRILFVGDHPVGQSGNSYMLKNLMIQVNRDEYDISCFAGNAVDFDPFALLPCNVITSSNPGDDFGQTKLLTILKNASFDLMVSVGIDIWHFHRIFGEIKELKKNKGLKWLAIFPYELHQVRKDWVEWIKLVDFPYVYSMYGYNKLKDHIPNIQYFRPVLDNAHLFTPASPEKRDVLRKHYFGNFDGDKKFVFGFVGVNQIRKDPQKIIKAFFEVKKSNPGIALYLHTNVGSGVYNLARFVADQDAKPGDIYVKNQNQDCSRTKLVEIYQAMDCLVNASYQEGLSWTLLEAMLCKTPVIASDNTSQTELINEGCGMRVPSTELAYVPLITENGMSYVESKAVSCEALIHTMRLALKENHSQRVTSAYKKAKDWVENSGNMNDLLNSTFDSMIASTKSVSIKDREKAVLFMQHSAAGDVFMTTRCMKGLKERHPELPLVYMTQKKFHNILEGHPYIDKLIDWDESTRNEYLFSYNPHGDKILPGHWGRNSNSILSDFYWKILHVKPDDFYIGYSVPGQFSYISTLAEPIAVVHTTGGDPHFRTYKYMGDVCEVLRKKGYLTIQLGSRKDFPAHADIDLRGELSYQESAWVMTRATIAITVDSFMSHLAGALGISQVCLFGSGNANVVKPSQMKGMLICLVPDYIRHCIGLGPCSASVRHCPSPCTSRHDPRIIIQAVEELEKHNEL